MDQSSSQCHLLRIRDLFKEKELWILFFIGLLYFHRPLFLNETFFFRDLYMHFFPQKQRFVELLRNGELPLWDSYLNGGQPFLADSNNVVLYPSNLFYLLLSLPRAFNWDIVLHIVFSSISAYCFVRVLGFRPVSCLVAGAVYGYCGYTLSLANFLYRILAMPYLPLLFLCWHHYLVGKKRRWFVFAVLSGVVQFLAGAPEMILFSLLCLLGWSLSYPYDQSNSRRIALWTVLVVFVVGISSIQLLPMIEMISESSRATGTGYWAFSAWSIHPKRLPEMIIPKFFGYTNRLSIRDYWGFKIEGGLFPYILNLYFGLLTLTLAIAGGLSGNEDGAFPQRARRFLFVLLVFAAFLSLGYYLPFFQSLYDFLPIIRLFRYPSKFLVVTILPVAVLAAYTSERCFDGKISVRKLQMPMWILAGLLLVFTGIFVFSDGFADAFQRFYFHQSGNVARQGLRESLLHTSAIWLLAVLILQYRQIKNLPWQHPAFAAIILADLLLAGQTINHYAPEEFLTRVPEVVSIVRKNVGDGRFYRVPNPRNLIIKIPANNTLYTDRWNLETLDNYLAAFYSIPVIFHEDFDGLAKKEITQLSRKVYLSRLGPRIPLLSTGSVTVILSPHRLPFPGMRGIATVKNQSNRLFYLYQNENAMNSVEFITSCISVNTDDEALNVIATPGFDARRQVVITGTAPPIKPGNCGKARISKILSGTHSSTYSVVNDCDGYLVFSEPFYPGWRITVDGNPTAILRANVAFSAIAVPSGTHHIERYYRPTSFYLGGLVSVVCLVLMFLRASCRNSEML